jgi:hypothetical protein
MNKKRKENCRKRKHQNLKAEPVNKGIKIKI